MRRRILAAIVGVTLLATVTLTVPLAVASSIQAGDDAVHELERVAQRVNAELPASNDLASDGVELPEFASVIDAAVYLPDGQRVAGEGPDRAGPVVRSTDLLTRHRVLGDQLVLTQPIVVGERKVGVIRVAEPVSESRDAVRRNLLIIIGLDLGALLLASLVGWVVATRMTRPLEAIRDDSIRLGNGDFSIVPRQWGVAELDSTSNALAHTAERLEDTIRRERDFAANASHQLRTPLTAMRLSVEGELAVPREDPTEALDEMMTELDRLESTIETLLTVAKNRVKRGRLDLDAWTSEFERRWRGPIEAAGRSLRLDLERGVSSYASSEVLDEICDVVMANALDHGHGIIAVTASGTATGITIAIADEGRLTRAPGGLFVRHDPNAIGHGVGLALARALAEAEGGRLVLQSTDPTVFRVHMPDSRGSE